jgi:hypothetical protein
MTPSRKLILVAAIGGAALLAGCATAPYDNYGYGYDRGYDPSYYGYDDPGYVAPSVGLGFTYSDRPDRPARDNDGRWRDRGDRRDSRDSRAPRNNDDDIRNNGGSPLWSQGNVYRGVGPNYDPQKDHGQYSPG